MNRLVQYARVLISRRRAILANSLVMTAIAIAVSFTLPRRYTATAQLLPPAEESDVFGLSGVLSGGIAGQIGKLRQGMLGSTTASDLIVGILESRTIMTNVALRCSITRYYHIQRNSLESAVRTLKDMTRLRASDDGIVHIAVEARSGRLAANVANTYICELDTFLRKSNMSRGHKMRTFIEGRLAEAQVSLGVSRDSLRDYQMIHRVASIDDETRAAIDEYAGLKSQLMLKEAVLAATIEDAADGNPYVTTLQREVASLNEELRRLEVGGSTNGYGVGFAVPFAALPTVAAEYARLYQKFRVNDEAYVLLYQQYDYAKIMEARDAPAITVLDYAVPPERHSSPKRSVIILAVLLFSLLAGAAYATVQEYFAGMKRTSPGAFTQWQSLRDEVGAALKVPRRLRRNRQP